MRSILICALALCSIDVYAKPKKQTVQPPTWWCFIGVDSNGDTTASCVREKYVCEFNLVDQEFVNNPNCFGQTKAAVFTITHTNDGHVEFDARPNMKVCRAVSRQMANDSPDVVIGECIEML